MSSSAYTSKSYKKSSQWTKKMKIYSTAQPHCNKQYTCLDNSVVTILCCQLHSTIMRSAVKGTWAIGCISVFLQYFVCNEVKLRMSSSVKKIPDVYKSSNSKFDLAN